jgi:hypothetical protein
MQLAYPLRLNHKHHIHTGLIAVTKQTLHLFAATAAPTNQPMKLTSLWYRYLLPYTTFSASIIAWTGLFGLIDEFTVNYWLTAEGDDNFARSWMFVAVGIAMMLASRCFLWNSCIECDDFLLSVRPPPSTGDCVRLHGDVDRVFPSSLRDAREVCLFAAAYVAFAVAFFGAVAAWVGAYTFLFPFIDSLDSKAVPMISLNTFVVVIPPAASLCICTRTPHRRHSLCSLSLYKMQTLATSSSAPSP